MRRPRCRGTAAATLLLLLSGCAAPALHRYVLGPGAAAGGSVVGALPGTVVELRPVLVPDAIDTSAILRRRGQELVASRNGRWASRLSVGVRQALAADLRRLLPGAAVVTASPLQPGFRRVSVTVDDLTADESGVLALDASWIVEAMPAGRVIGRRRAHLVTALDSGDAAQAAATGLLLQRLAAAMAGDL